MQVIFVRLSVSLNGDNVRVTRSPTKRMTVQGQTAYVNHVVSDDLLVLMQDGARFKFFALPSLTYLKGVDNVSGDQISTGEATPSWMLSDLAIIQHANSAKVYFVMRGTPGPNYLHIYAIPVEFTFRSGSDGQELNKDNYSVGRAFLVQKTQITQSQSFVIGLHPVLAGTGLAWYDLTRRELAFLRVCSHTERYDAAGKNCISCFQGFVTQDAQPESCIFCNTNSDSRYTFMCANLQDNFNNRFKTHYSLALVNHRQEPAPAPVQPQPQPPAPVEPKSNDTISNNTNTANNTSSAASSGDGNKSTESNQSSPTTSTSITPEKPSN